MVASAVRQQRLQRREKMPGRIAKGSLVRAIRAEFSAQPGEEFGGAGYLRAAALQPLEFSQKVAARQRRQPLQIILYRIRPHHCPKLPARVSLSTGPSRAGVNGLDPTPKKVPPRLRSKPDARETTGTPLHG